MMRRRKRDTRWISELPPDERDLDVEGSRCQVGDATMTDWLLSGLAMLTGESKYLPLSRFAAIESPSYM
jgi:hypothetical protein